MIQNKTLYLWLLALLFFVPCIHAEEDETAEDPWISTQWLDEQQELWANRASSTGQYIDGFMGDTDVIQDQNNSYLKLYFDFDISKKESVETKPRVKFSLDLPITKKRFRLVIESDLDQENSIEERNLSHLPSTANSTNEGLNASFRHIFDSSKWQRLSLDWGVKAKWPPDPFVRARAVRAWELNDYWDMVYSQEFFWFETKGLGTYSQFDFDRLLSTSFLFRWTTVLDWHERQEQFDLLEQVSLFQDIDEKQAIQYSLGFTNQNRKRHAIVTNYYTKATYRRRLYKDWLFCDLTPGVEFPREDDYKANPFINFRLEVLFTKDTNRKLTTKLY